MKTNKKLCVSNEHSRGCLTFRNDLPSCKQYHPWPVVDRRQCRCTLHQRPISCSSNAPISASRDCAADVELWLVILPNTLTCPSTCAAHVLTLNKVWAEIRPVSANFMSRPFSIDCTVVPSTAARHSCVGLCIKARRGSVLTPCTRVRTVRSCNCKSAGCTILVRGHKLLPLIFRVLEVTPVGAVPDRSSMRAALVW